MQESCQIILVVTNKFSSSVGCCKIQVVSSADFVYSVPASSVVDINIHPHSSTC